MTYTLTLLEHRYDIRWENKSHRNQKPFKLFCEINDPLSESVNTIHANVSKILAQYHYNSEDTY